MSELVVLAALTPLAFLTLKISARGQVFLCWLSAALSLLGLVYFLWLKQGGPLQWGVVVGLLSLLLLNSAKQKKITAFTVLNMVFISLASMTSELGEIIIFLAFSDFIQEVEAFTDGSLSEKNQAIKNVYRSLVSLLPAGLTVILQAGAQGVAVGVALSVALRIFSWPVRHWVSEKNSQLYYLIIAGASSFALWRIVDSANQPEWSLIWLCAAALFSFGARDTELFLASVLAMFSLSPVWGLLGIALWPLALNRGVTTYLLYGFIAAAGVLVSEGSTHVVLENAAYGISAMTALLLARNLVNFTLTPRPWYKEAGAFALSALIAGIFIYLMPPPQVSFGPLGGVFLGVFALTFIIGKALQSRQLKFFALINRVKAPTSLLATRSMDLLRERSGPSPDIVPKTYLVRFFDNLESEAQFVWLLGLLGVAIWWGLK